MFLFICVTKTALLQIMTAKKTLQKEKTAKVYGFGG